MSNQKDDAAVTTAMVYEGVVEEAPKVGVETLPPVGPRPSEKDYIEAVFEEVLNYQKEFPISEFDADYKGNIFARYLEDLLHPRKPLEGELKNKTNKLKSRISKDCAYFDYSKQSKKSFILERLKYHLGTEEKNEELDKTSFITLFVSVTIIFFLFFSSATSVDQKLRRASIMVPIGTMFVSFAGDQKIRRTRYLGHLVNIAQNR